MPVKIGNSYVTEAALAYAQERKDEKSENVLSDLSKQFKDINFSVGTQPFGGSGTNNITISPNILRQMANDPEKRMEYEALIYDFDQVLKSRSNSPEIKSQGVVINSKGETSMWAIRQYSDDKPNRSLMNLMRKDKQHSAGRSTKKSNKVSTEKVDAEIRLLKNRKLKLEQQLLTSANPDADLQKQLAQIENELRQKDNDTYRKARSKFSTGIDIIA